MLALENRADAVRRPCIEALGRFGIEEAVPSLVSIAKDPAQTVDIRAAAVRALKEIAPDQVLDELVKIARDQGEQHLLRVLASLGHGIGADAPKVHGILKALRPELGEKRALPQTGF
jgi:HEAT repeat protein